MCANVLASRSSISACGATVKCDRLGTCNHLLVTLENVLCILGNVLPVHIMYVQVNRMYLCMCVCKYECMYVGMDECMYVCVHVCIYVICTSIIESGSKNTIHILHRCF
jgi:hypothetical protein